MSREDPQFRIRLPADLKAEIEAAAEANVRSLNAEIVARLQLTVDSEFQLSPEGYAAFIKRLEVYLQASEEFSFKLLSELRLAGGSSGKEDEAITKAIEKLASDTGRRKAQVIQLLLREILEAKGYLTKAGTPSATG